MEEKLRKLFKEAIMEIIRQEDIQASPDNPFMVQYPRTFFMQVIKMTEIELSAENLQEMGEEFSDVLGEFNIKIAPGAFLKKMEKRKKFPRKRRSKWVTPKIMKDAWAAEFRHPRDAKGL